MKKKAPIYGLAIIGIISLPFLLVAARMRQSRQYYEQTFEKINSNYPVGPNTVLLITRPINHRPFSKLYPVYYYTFFNIGGQEFGYHFCAWTNLNNCPDLHGPHLMPNSISLQDVANRNSWDYYLVSDTAGKDIMQAADELYQQFDYKSELHALLDNVYNKFTMAVLEQCGL